MARVITYRLAYLNRTVTLCRRHTEQPPAPLGPVEHGEHEGICDECEKQPQTTEEV